MSPEFPVRRRRVSPRLRSLILLPHTGVAVSMVTDWPLFLGLSRLAFFFSRAFMFLFAVRMMMTYCMCVYRSSSWNSHHLQPYLKQSSGFDFFFLVLFVCEWVPAQQIPETLKKAIQADKKQSMPMTKSLNGFFFQMLCSPICSLSCIWYTLFWTHMYICINCWLTAKE